MEEIGSAADLEAALTRHTGCVGLVPLTFDLHEGHLSIVRRARQERVSVIVSLFNQIHHGLNLSEVRIPRAAARDRALLELAGVDLLYHAGPFPSRGTCWVDVDRLSSCWEGMRYPRHFRAVATILCKLLVTFNPSDVYLGEKDYQQLRVVTELAAELFPGTRVHACSTVRDSAGIALSTSTLDLSPNDRQRAAALFRALVCSQELVASGELECARLCRAMLTELDRNGLRPDYVAVVDAQTLVPLAVVDREARALIAAFLGGVRLTDNIRLSPR